MKKEIERLHGLGFAVHLLLPKSKRPIEMKWTSGPRKTLDELLKNYKAGMNIGVRLGEASKVGNGFLAVVDCDVKSDNLDDLKKMLDKLGELFPDGELGRAPTVVSGRGNGSQHRYIVTDKPTAPKLLARSPYQVKVLMPSSGRPSKVEHEQLSRDEIKKGVRLRPAWEISLMGEGQQVVLPPSLHPDSGIAYKWGKSLEAVENLPLVVIEGKTLKKEKENLHDFDAVTVDLVGSSLSEKVLGMILTGDGVEDRSAGLFTAAIAMVSAGFSDLEIMSVLTDRDNFLGEVAFEHTKSESRRRAAEWILNYTLKKARAETSAACQFADEMIETPLLSEVEAALQFEEVVTEKDDFTLHIERGRDDKPKNTMKNAQVILQGEFGEAAFLKNEFTNKRICGRDFPWGKKSEAINDETVVLMKKWFSNKYRCEPSSDKIWEAVVSIAAENKFHPIRDWLDSLPEWDGVPRVNTWLKVYLRAHAPEPYLSTISRKVLCAMVARIYEPAIKFDNVLVLEGPEQGEGKSRSVMALAGGQEYFGKIDLKLPKVEKVLLIQGKWVVELDELSGLNKAEVESVKSFLTDTTDEIRTPYGRLPEQYKRQGIFIGTTNKKDYLRDPTGNRRFWPVHVEGLCDVEGLERDRIQLFAEAKLLYEMGEQLWLERDIEILARQVQSERMEYDTWVEVLQDAFNGKDPNWKVSEDGFSMRELFDAQFGPLAAEKDTIQNQMRAAKCLNILGYKSVAKCVDGKGLKRWVKKR